MKTSRLLRNGAAALLAANIAGTAYAQESKLESHPLSGYVELADVPRIPFVYEPCPSNHEFVPVKYNGKQKDDGKPVTTTVVGPYNSWPEEALPEHCRKSTASPAMQKEKPRKSRFEFNYYADGGWPGWANGYSKPMAGLLGTHMSFANLTGSSNWKIGTFGLLLAYSPKLDDKNKIHYGPTVWIPLLTLSRRVGFLKDVGEIYFTFTGAKELQASADSRRNSDGSTTMDTFVGFSLKLK